MKKFTYILSILFVMSLVFTGCTKLDVIDPTGDVEQQDYRGIDGDELDDDGASTGWGGNDDDDDDDDGGGITDEDDDEDEDDSDTQRGSTTTI